MASSPPTPIEELIASWKDLTVEVKVNDPELPITGPSWALWSLQKVKDRLEGSKGSPIICPSLEALSIPMLALNTNLDRAVESGLGEEEVKRLFEENPRFLGRALVAQKSACMVDQSSELDAYINLVQGEACFIHHKKKKDGEQDNENKSSWFLRLDEGKMLILPPNTVWSMFFTKDTLLLVGDLLPPQQRSTETEIRISQDQ